MHDRQSQRRLVDGDGHPVSGQHAPEPTRQRVVHLARARLLVEALHIAFLSDFERGIDEDLDELAFG